MSTDENDINAIKVVRKRVDEYIAWWLEEIDNPAYVALTYLNATGQIKSFYEADIKSQDYSFDGTVTERDNQPRVSAAQNTDITSNKTNRAEMIARTWTQVTFPIVLHEYSLVLPDSTRLFRTIRPIVERKTGKITGFLAIDLHFENIFGMDVASDRRLLLTSSSNKKIIHDAFFPENSQKETDEVYPGLLDILMEENQETGGIDVSYEHENTSYSVYSMELEDPNWRVTCLVDDSDYMNEASDNGAVLIITAFLFVAIAGISIVILTRRVEDRTRKLAQARDQLVEELNAAHELQMGLMPQKAPSNLALDIAGKCQPAAQVGGDFFQYFELEDNRIVITMADVTGHGMRAAVPTMVFSGLLSNQIIYSDTVEDLFVQLNRSLLNTLERRTFICFALGEIDIESNVVQLANSGCPYPYYYNAEDNELQEIAISALPLGLHKDPEYPVSELKISTGDRIIFYSDGIVEATNKEGELFGFEKTSDIIKRGCEQDLGSQELIDFVFEEVEKHSGDIEQEDDQTMVVLASG